MKRIKSIFFFTPNFVIQLMRLHNLLHVFKERKKSYGLVQNKPHLSEIHSTALHNILCKCAQDLQ